MNNSNFDNKYSNGVVGIVGTIIRTFERSFIVFFDGLRMATVHGTPSMVNFLAALAPIIAPLPMAAMTGKHLMDYLAWYPWQAILMAISLEIVGFPLWVFTTESIFIDGWKGTARQFWLVGATAVYETIIILINVILSAQNGDLWTAVGIFFLACLVPAICGVAYSYSNMQNKQAIEREQMELREAQLRQEKSDERLKKTAIKSGQGHLIFGGQQFAAETPQVEVKETKEKHASDYRDKAIEFIVTFYEKNRTLPAPKQLTERFSLEHSKNKGYMSSLIKEVALEHGWS